MGGTVSGGHATRDTNKKRYGDDYYVKLGRKGGLVSRTGGFYNNRERARVLGAIGGHISRRGYLSKCLKGHPFTEDNVTYVGRRRIRRCTICLKQWQQAYYEKRRAKGTKRYGKKLQDLR